MKSIFFLSVFLFLSLFASSQKKNEAYQLHIKRASSPIIIDGIVNEKTWEDGQVASNFFMVLPMDTSAARVRTDVLMSYDDQNLYLLAVCYHAVPGPYYVESLRRDFVFGKNDNFLLFMDPFDDQTNGFSFGANAAGAQWDGTMYEGGKVDLNWDNKWNSSVKSYPDKWIFEAAIPFTSIRYKKGITRWGINFSRMDLKTTEKSSWAPVPRQFPTASLAYSGILVWDVPPPTPSMNVSIIPYALGGITKDYSSGEKATFRKEIGVDAKIAVTSSLNLDLTVNPDFSQVEVDRQVTNLDRFELFFPERRQFFLENADLFSNTGYTNLRPFFSRRIGLGVPINYGIRLSGKPDKNWRIGLMNLQTGKVSETGLPAQNFTVAAVQRQVFARSNIGLMFINKESLRYHPDSVKPAYSAYNRNLGIEYNLASSNNLWTGKFLLLKSFSPGKNSEDLANAGNLQYASRKWTIGLQYEYVGTNYTAEVGYVPRRGYTRINPTLARNFFPKGSRVLSHGPRLSSAVYFDKKFSNTDYETILSYNIAFRDQSIMNVSFSEVFIRLLQPFDPTNTGMDSISSGTEHKWKGVTADFTSKPQKLFTYFLSMGYGGYYEHGKRFYFNSDIGYRFQPYVSISVNTSYNNIELGKPWGTQSFFLVGPRVDITFTNKLFLTAFMQYNEQTDNINLNTRFQWRYKPASDLFIVYTDNYYPAPFSVRNRALVVKFNYWWNR